jgi:DNA-binding response OmpR family regulator
MRILLIEDDETLCQTIPFQLHQEGFSVDVATHGEDGLHFARERVHDLILLDRIRRLEGVVHLEEL